jgi:hypothetical protein
VQYTYANQTTLYVSAGLVKLAVALVLFRISVARGVRWLLIGSMVVVGIWTVITVVFASWLCATTGTSNWAGSATCTRVGYFRTISNIFIDYFYALLPIYILRGSQMKTRLKLIAIFLLGLGILYDVPSPPSPPRNQDSAANISHRLLVRAQQQLSNSSLSYVYHTRPARKRRDFTTTYSCGPISSSVSQSLPPLPPPSAHS